MASRIPDLVERVSAAIAAERRDLAEVARHRAAALEQQIDVATTLSKSRQLSAELSSVAVDALHNQRERGDAMQAAADERRDLLDRISTDLSDLLGSRPDR